MRDNKKIYLRKLLGDTDYDAFIRAIAADKIILDGLSKVIQRRMKETGLREDIMDDPMYSVKRPFLDGRNKELRWLLELITEEDSDES